MRLADVCLESEQLGIPVNALSVLEFDKGAPGFAMVFAARTRDCIIAISVDGAVA